MRGLSHEADPTQCTSDGDCVGVATGVVTARARAPVALAPTHDDGLELGANRAQSVGATLPLAASWNGGLTRRLTLFAAPPAHRRVSGDSQPHGRRRAAHRCTMSRGRVDPALRGRHCPLVARQSAVRGSHVHLLHERPIVAVRRSGRSSALGCNESTGGVVSRHARVRASR